VRIVDAWPYGGMFALDQIWRELEIDKVLGRGCVRARLVRERIAEIRGGDTWRNLVARLDTIKVVEYLRGEARVRQTTEVRGDVAALLRKLGVPAPPPFHAIEAARAA
jgi:hypothetical protein